MRQNTSRYSNKMIATDKNIEIYRLTDYFSQFFQKSYALKLRKKTLHAKLLRKKCPAYI